MINARDLERESLHDFVHSAAPELRGKVLDYGCGRQPYRDLVAAAGGVYHGFDRTTFAGNVSGCDVGAPWIGMPGMPPGAWDAILCTQVVQYVPRVSELLEHFRFQLRPAGVLVLTWPTNWDEVEDTDLHRFTAAGMRRLLESAGFTIERVERRARVEIPECGFGFTLGYGAVARA